MKLILPVSFLLVLLLNPAALLAVDQMEQGVPGFWGEMQFSYHFLQPLDKAVERMGIDSIQTRWIFPNMGVDECRERLLEAGVFLHDFEWGKEYFATKDGVIICPSDSYIASMPPQHREQMARLLGQWPQNILYRCPTVIPFENINSWYTESGLSSNMVSFILSVCYSNGRALCLTDKSYVLSRLETETERKLFMKFLLRQKSVSAKVRCAGSDQDERVYDYWLAGGREPFDAESVKAVLDATRNDWVDVRLLLPPLPKALLGTYPLREGRYKGVVPNCHWISKNFFAGSAETVDPYDGGSSVFDDGSFEVVDRPGQLGDVLALFDSETGVLLHSSVYIAGDIVFTKNGMGALTPWVLMSRRDMESIYDAKADPLVVKVYRRRPVKG